MEEFYDVNNQRFLGRDGKVVLLEQKLQDDIDRVGSWIDRCLFSKKVFDWFYGRGDG